jgi:aryl-alcohol dehydrogenase-like predicted oxidoreductase
MLDAALGGRALNSLSTFQTDQTAKGKYDSTADADKLIVERVAELATKYDATRTHIALAWLLQKQPVVAPIIGATKIAHLDEAVGALQVTLSSADVAYLEEPYVPHRVVGAI